MGDMVAFVDATRGAAPGAIRRGRLTVDLRLPLPPSVALLRASGSAGSRLSFGLHHDEMLGFVFLHRNGERLLRHVLSGHFSRLRGAARLEFCFDTLPDQWRLSLVLMREYEDDTLLFGAGAGVMALEASLAEALSGADPARLYRDPSVLHHGLVCQDDLPATGHWFGPRTRLATTRGQVLAAHLRQGDCLLAEDGAPVPLTRVETRDLPPEGPFAPVILRAPYYGLTEPVLVSADLPLVFSGSETEYLFDEDEVLIQPADMLDGRSAVTEAGRAGRGVVRLAAARPAIIPVHGARVALPGPEGLPARLLAGFEARSLLSLIRQRGTRPTG